MGLMDRHEASEAGNSDRWQYGVESDGMVAGVVTPLHFGCIVHTIAPHESALSTAYGSRYRLKISCRPH